MLRCSGDVDFKGDGQLHGIISPQSMFVRQLRRCGHYFGREIENAQVMFEVMLETHDSGCGIGRRDQQALAFASDCGNYFDVRNSRDVDAIKNGSVKKVLGLLEDLAKDKPEDYAKFLG